MGYGLHVLLIYKDGIRGMEYSYCWYIGMGYGIWAMDCMYCWYIGMGYGYGLRYCWYIGMEHGLWTKATAGILGLQDFFGQKLNFKSTTNHVCNGNLKN